MVFSHVPTTKVRAVSHMLKAIHAQETRQAADRKARAIVDDLRGARMHTAADLVENSVQQTLTYYAFPDIHWQKIRANNPLERIMKEDPKAHARCRSVSRRRGTVALYCRNGMVSEALHKHAPTLSAGDRNRSRRCLIKCAKDFRHYPLVG